MEPRPFQTKIVNQVVELFDDHRAVMVQAATGSGKSLIGKMVSERLGSRAIVISHSRSVNDQWRTDYSFTTMHPLVLDRNFDNLDFDEGDLLIVDEVHHYSGNLFAKIANQWPGKILGLTATPWRREDTRGFDQIFTHLVRGPSFMELVDAGYLAEPTVVTPVGTITDIQSRKAATAATDALRTKLNTHHIVAWAESRAALKTRQSLWFMASASAAMSTVSLLRGRDIPSALVLAVTTADVRAEAEAKFRSGEIKALVTVGALLEGTDLPNCDTIVLGRPMTSLVGYLQAIGRATRPDPGKMHVLILDYAASVADHGLPTDPFRWSLTSREDARNCPECRAEGFNEVCVECGYIVPADARREGQEFAILTCATCGFSCRLTVTFTGCQKCGADGEMYDPERVQVVAIGGVKFQRDPDTGAFSAEINTHRLVVNPANGQTELILGEVKGRIPKGFKNGAKMFKSLAAAMKLLG